VIFNEAKEESFLNFATSLETQNKSKYLKNANSSFKIFTFPCFDNLLAFVSSNDMGIGGRDFKDNLGLLKLMAQFICHFELFSKILGRVQQ